MEQSLKDKTVSGVGWSAIDNVSQYSITFVIGVVLARLLSPDDYGLIGIVGIFTTICNTLISYGFSAALIRKKVVTEDDYSTIFIVNLVMSAILYITIFLCAPLIAVFFERDELVLLTRVSSIGMIIGALALVQQTRLTKRIDFKTQTKITLTASMASGLIGIAMALLGCGVWSLVVQGLASTTIKTSLLWFFNHWTPCFHFSKTSFNELFGFGWKLMLSALLDGVWKDLYQVIIGKFYTPASLGQFTRAKHFSQLFSSNLTNVVQRVTFPILSDIQDERTRMISVYRRIIKTTMFVTTLCMFFLGAISEPLLYCLIGPKWHEASLYLPPICIIASLYPLHAINLNMLQVQGRSDLFLGIEILKKIIAVGPLCVGIFVGIMPMLYVDIVVGIIAFFINSYYSGKLLGYSSWMQIKDIVPSFIIAFIVAISVFFLKYLPLSNWIILPLQLIFGSIVFFIINGIVNLGEYKEIVTILKNLTSRIYSQK